MSERITADGYVQVSVLKEEPKYTLMTDRGKCAFTYNHGWLQNMSPEGVQLNCGKCGIKLAIDTEAAFDVAESIGEGDVFPDGSCLPGQMIMLRQNLGS